MQTSAHLEALREYARTVELRQPLDLIPGCFGENLFLDGGPSFSSDTICIGDEFGAFRDGADTPVLTVQVSSPRRPCSKVDVKHGATYTEAGIRATCAHSGHAGFMLRVLVSSSLSQSV